jgi:hypothetical protein
LLRMQPFRNTSIVAPRKVHFLLNIWYFVANLPVERMPPRQVPPNRGML